MLCHTNLENWYQTVFAMAQHHKYSISELEGMIPFERDLYFGMLINFIEKQKEIQQAK